MYGKHWRLTYLYSSYQLGLYCILNCKIYTYLVRPFEINSYQISNRQERLVPNLSKFWRPWYAEKSHAPVYADHFSFLVFTKLYKLGNLWKNISFKSAMSRLFRLSQCTTVFRSITRNSCLRGQPTSVIPHFSHHKTLSTSSNIFRFQTLYSQ